MKISSALAGIQGSATAKIFAEAKRLERNGKKIIHLEIGQPDFKPPKKVLEGAAFSVLAGDTSYTVSRGILELREEVTKYHKSTNNVNLDPTNETIITSGAKLAIFASLWTVINRGDNVIVLNPSWVSYKDMILALGAESRFLAVDENFQFDLDKLRSLINSQTKAIIVNSPSNPTGAVISKKYLQELFNISAENDLLLISDEIYSEYIYGDFTHNSLMDINGWKDNGIVINGLSKTFSMTGFRLGYVLANNQIIEEVNKVNQLTSSCPVNFAQHAAITAFQNVDEMRQIINSIMPERRNLVIKLANEISIPLNHPQGAFYAWLNIPGMNNSVDWCKQLLTNEGVALTPGRAFGPDGEGFVRLSFANTSDNIKQGFQGINKFLQTK